MTNTSDDLYLAYDGDGDLHMWRDTGGHNDPVVLSQYDTDQQVWQLATANIPHRTNARGDDDV